MKITCFKRFYYKPLVYRPILATLGVHFQKRLLYYAKEVK
jgi:hypothetical protein